MARKSPSAPVKLDESIAFVSDEERLLLRLRHVNNKLSAADTAFRRLVAERAEISPEDYVARLKKTKLELGRQAQKLLAKDYRAGRNRFPAGGFAHAMAPGRSSHGERYGFHKGKIILPDALPVARSMAGPDQVSGGACPVTEDILTQPTPVIMEGRSLLHHGSSAGIGVDQQFVMTDGLTFARVFLHDDAAWWRDDNSDWYIGAYGLEWTFPPAPCDVFVICRIDAQQRIEFTNAADDYGRAKTGILPQWTDENGAWAYVDTAHDATITFEGESSGSAVSERFAMIKTFPVRAGVTPRFRVFHFAILAARDGVVSVLAQFRTSQRFVDSGPPSLWYMFWPQNSSCFITSAICGVLGKPDDCEELQRLRAFRDGYLRQRPDGEALIREYYDRAPSLLHALQMSKRKAELLRHAYFAYLRPALDRIATGRYGEAVQIYREMVTRLEAQTSVPGPA